MTSHPPILAFPIGTLTSQGTFIGMYNKNLAQFEKKVSHDRSHGIICSPKLAKVITQEEDDERIAIDLAWQAKGFWGQSTVLRGDAARAALANLA